MSWSRRHSSLVAAACRSCWPQAALAQNTAAAPPAAPRRRPGSRSESHRSPTSRSSTCRRRCACRGSRARSASRTASAGRSAQGDFGDLAEDLFGLDSGAQIGLEYRFGLMRGAAGRHPPHQQPDDRVLQRSTACCSSATTADRPRRHRVDRRHQQLQATATRRRSASSCRASWAATARVYVEPMWVNNSNPLPSELVDDNDTFMLGLGARIRIRPTVYIVGEFIPRLGYEPGVNHGTFGIEKRAGGHMFQLNFSNGFGTTMGQLARGGTGSDDWYLGLQHLEEVLLMTGHRLAAAAFVRCAARARPAAGCGGGSNPGTGPSGGGGGGGGGTDGTTTTITITASGVSPRDVTVAAGLARDVRQQRHAARTTWPRIRIRSTRDCPRAQRRLPAAGQSGTTQNLNTVRTCGFHDHNQPSDTALQGTIRIQ